MIDGNVTGIAVPGAEASSRGQAAVLVAGAFFVHTMNCVDDDLAGHRLRASAHGPVHHKTCLVAELGAVGVILGNVNATDGDSAVFWSRCPGMTPATVQILSSDLSRAKRVANTDLSNHPETAIAVVNNKTKSLSRYILLLQGFSPSGC